MGETTSEATSLALTAALLGRAHVLRREARAISPQVLPRGLGVGWRMHF